MIDDHKGRFLSVPSAALKLLALLSPLLLPALAGCTTAEGTNAFATPATFEREVMTSTLQGLDIVPQEVNRVFINLIGNGFYAATKRQQESGEASFRPILKVVTRDLGEAVEIRIRDNGIGIPTEIKDKLFQPFFTTKPTGEGTGLGLSISYDIVTQQHGGTITVDSRVGEFTEFIVRLPRTHPVTMPEAAS